MEKVPTVAVAAPNPVSSSTAGVGEAGNVPRWVIAAAVGVPVAAALAYILFGPSSDSEGKSSKKKKKKADLKADDNGDKIKSETVTKVKSSTTDEVNAFRNYSKSILFSLFRAFQWKMSKMNRRIR